MSDSMAVNLVNNTECNLLNHHTTEGCLYKKVNYREGIINFAILNNLNKLWEYTLLQVCLC